MQESSSVSQKTETAEDENAAQKQNPCLRRQEKGTDCYDAEYHKYKTDIISLPILKERLSFFMIVSHNITPYRLCMCLLFGDTLR